MTEKYYNPFSYTGLAKDIKWCDKWRGGKHCAYCKRYANNDEWKNNWVWHYLLKWSEYTKYRGYLSYAHRPYRVYKYGAWRNKNLYNAVSRYRTAGISEFELKSFLKNGCKKNRKCRCMKLAQRGSWYCPTCYKILSKFSSNHNIEIHDLMVADRKDIKQNILISLLSRTL